uniref:Si:ch211-110p13.9 n=1 Tax=Lepisosteus oculatus TaxID=7918 RepID=W5MDX3_LEPOC
AQSLCLPQWDVGMRSVRFLYLAGPRTFKVCKKCDAEEGLVPLFLGADLFSNTGIRTENHTRFHAKFAKKGLASKLSFSSEFRFHGLRLPCGTNRLWFYSIQGLFRVAFEMYSKREQLFVLETFQELWKSRINDEPLNPCYDLSVQLCPAPPGDNSITETDTVNISYDTSDSVPTADHNYCSPENMEDPSHQVSQKNEQIKVMLLLLDHMQQYMTQEFSEKGLTDIVLQVLKATDHLVQRQTSVGSWLGQQFNSANAIIEGFKKSHINRIADLPPAEELVSKLFPESMKTLLINWMGLNDASALWKRQSEYPILLLILEFANHNLITGVAHVLYSSLILYIQDYSKG